MMLSHLALTLLAALSAEELLSRAIQYHDPDGRWERARFTIALGESRPDGTERRTTVRFDNPKSRFEMEREVEGGQKMKAVVVSDDVSVTLDGASELSAEDRERHGLAPDQLRRMRNYYLYLYGLPMKLRDPGTRIDPEAKEASFQGRDAYELRVTYDEGVGSDTWYFYFDRATSALIGYRFYHDESAGDGEYIVLTEEASGAGLKLPRVRKWYTHQGDRYLGTDTILSIAEH